MQNPQTAYFSARGSPVTVLIEQTFASPAHCASNVQHLIPDLQIVQLEASEDTRISVRIVMCGTHVFMRWRVHCKVMFFGPRLNDGLPLGFITEDWKMAEGAWTQGDQLVPGCLAGTRFNRDQMYFGMEAGTTLDCAIMSEAAFIRNCKVVCGPQMMDRLKDINIALPDADHLRRLERAVMYRLCNPGPDPDQRLEDQLVLMVMQLLDNAFVGDGLIQCAPSRWEVQKAIIDFADQLPPGVPPKVKDLASCLRWSEDTLIRATKEKFGMKPLDLMKSICLEQARRMILIPEKRENAGLKTIGDIHRHFGWVKSGPFAQNYADLFGVKPSDEFVRAR